MWLHSDVMVLRYRLTITLKMADDSGSPWKRPSARSSGCISHSFEAITGIRPEYNERLDSSKEVPWQIIVNQSKHSKTFKFQRKLQLV